MKKVLLLAAAILASLAVAQVRLELRALLTGQGKGKAVWKVRDRGGEMQAQLEISAERLQFGGHYFVETGGRTWEVIASGVGAIRIAETYLGPNRPNIAAGSAVTIEEANGVPILAGSFQ